MRAALCALPLLIAAQAVACDGPPVCTVTDPTGTPLNVRNGPQGRILATLQNGRQVEILEHREEKGQLWALVAGFDPEAGILAEDGAWVFASYLRCEGATSGLPAEPWTADAGQEVPCTVADPTGTPLNLRADPGGEIWGAVRNGTVVRALATRRHDGKAWVFVSRWTEDNAIGWVYDPYLTCAEDA
jgi:hypothetical protein